LQKVILELAWEERKKYYDSRKDEKLVERWRQWDNDNFKRYLLPDSEKPIPPTEFKPFIEDNWIGYVSITDIFVKYYHWTLRRGQKKFSRIEIGITPYMAAYVAVSKALTRLQDRKLICFLSGWKRARYYLTSEGYDLMAKKNAV